VTSLLVGARSVSELDENLDLLRREIPGEVWEDLRTEGLLPEEAPTP